MARETARVTAVFRFLKPETPKAAHFIFLGNETRAKSGFVSYVSFSLCFDFDPTLAEEHDGSIRVCKDSQIASSSLLPLLSSSSSLLPSFTVTTALVFLRLLCDYPTLTSGDSCYRQNAINRRPSISSKFRRDRIDAQCEMHLHELSAAGAN